MPHRRFEYRSEKGITPFEVFLQYTDEKTKSAAVLKRIMRHLFQGHGRSLVDVGAGNGEFLGRALNGLQGMNPTRIDLVEPSPSLVRQLRQNKKKISRPRVVRVCEVTAEQYSPGQSVDVVLASHLPYSKDQLSEAYRRFISWLKPGGSLIVVLRDKDDIHSFRTRFKSLLYGTPTSSLTIEDARVVLEQLRAKGSIRFSTKQARASLSIPWPENPTHTRLIIEFLLNQRWKDFPDEIKQEVLKYIEDKQGRLSINDSFLVATTRE